MPVADWCNNCGAPWVPGCCRNKAARVRFALGLSRPLPRGEHILCSALYYDDGRVHRPADIRMPKPTGLVVCGFRHDHCFQVLEQVLRGAQYIARDDAAWMRLLTAWELEDALARAVHGFVTSTGRFVDRDEAGRIAFAAGQTSRVLDSLTSEELWPGDQGGAR